MGASRYLDWFDVAESVGVLGALAIGIWQLRQGNIDSRRRDEDIRTERSLKLHTDIVAEGATHEAFHELSVFLRERGTEQFGTTTWYLLTDNDFFDAGLMVNRGNDGRYFRHVYTVLWFFERAEIALKRGLVNEDVLFHSIGYHIWWWNELFIDLQHPKARGSLHRLAQKTTTWAKEEQVLDDWQSRCSTDFNLRPPRGLHSVTLSS